MYKDFDFDEIEKRMPYSAPENFFDKAYENTLKLALKRKKRNFVIKISSITVAAMALVLAGLFLLDDESAQTIPGNTLVRVTPDSLSTPTIVNHIKDTSVNINDIIMELSDQELEDLMNNAEIDVLYAGL